MAYNKEFVFNEEQITAFLTDAMNGLEHASNADIQAVEEIKKVFKRNVPLLSRSNVTAWLIKQAHSYRPRFGREQGERQERSRERGEQRFSRERQERPERAPRERVDRERPAREERSEKEREEHPHMPRVQIDPAVAATIFVGIGRNRRVFPRDLVGLLVSVANVERERIGEIRVLTNYSFVQLYAEDCEKVINALNGYDYRGRKLSVSYSKQKEESAGEKPASDSSPAAAPAPEGGAAAPAVPAVPAAEEEHIPDSVTNTAHAVEASATDAIAAEQGAFAAQQAAAPAPQQDAAASPSEAPAERQPFAETAEDGQVTSHFGSGEAY